MQEPKVEEILQESTATQIADTPSKGFNELKLRVTACVVDYPASSRLGENRANQRNSQDLGTVGLCLLRPPYPL